MREWTKNKPSGFGEGKVYDTCMEDKLLEELEQSRVAQIANVNNLKNNPEDGNPKPKLPKQKVPEMVPNGTRLVHLPKKKNTHRDLQAAFKPFSGIVNIIPAVSGTEKTREPVCKETEKVGEKGKKKMITEKKVKNMPKLSIPGSAANRLKMKDKALLSGVFSKYGSKSAMAAKGTEILLLIFHMLGKHHHDYARQLFKSVGSLKEILCFWCVYITLLQFLGSWEAYKHFIFICSSPTSAL